MRVLLAVVAAFAFASVANAEGKPNFKIGQLELHPSYGLTTTYDDNIYLVPPDQASGARVGGGVLGSWILKNNLDLKLVLPVGDRHKFSGGYGIESHIYETQSKANNAFNQSAAAAYDFKGARTVAKVWDNYTNTQDPQFQPNNVLTGSLTERERRWQNVGGLSGEYALGDKFFVGAAGQDTVHKYLNPGLAATLNRSELLFGIKTGYRLQPKTRVFVAANRQLVHYSAGRAANHKDWLVDVGVEGQLTAKLKGMVQAGLQNRFYDNTAVANTTRNRSVNNAQYRAQLNFAATERTDLDLVANRGLNETSSPGSGGQYYTSTGLSLAASHKWNKLKFGLGGGWQVDKYAEAVTQANFTAVRRDDLYNGSASVVYSIQEWLQASLDYSHLRRHSIFTGQFNYKVNRTSVGVKLLF